MTEIVHVLEQALAKGAVSEAQWPVLINWELADRARSEAWGITTANAQARLAERFRWLQTVLPHHASLPLPAQPLEAYLPLYWQLWLPLALWLRSCRQKQSRPWVQGFLGGQGTGKTTLSQVLTELLKTMGYRAVGLSIDDLYKTYAERQQLKLADPRLIWRGPPGTHDVALGVQTLQHICHAPAGQPVFLPRFDKSLQGGEGDRVEPQPVQDVDIVLFEGWFLGARPIAPARFDQPLPDPIKTAADGQFARDTNQRLQEYLPLWELLDHLIVLLPQDYRISQQWRRQAEHQMKAAGKPGMTDETIDAFVEYFWKALHPDLFILPLRGEAPGANLIIEIGPDRMPRSIYAPGKGALSEPGMRSFSEHQP